VLVVFLELTKWAQTKLFIHKAPPG